MSICSYFHMYCCNLFFYLCFVLDGKAFDVRNYVVSIFICMWWIINLPWFEFESEKFLWFYLCYLVWRITFACLVVYRWQVWYDKDCCRSRRPGAEDRDGQVQIGYLMTERLRCQVMLCAVCIVQMKTRSPGFLVEPQNQGRRFISDLTSKSLGRILSVWPKSTATVSPDLASKSVASGFLIWVSKSTASVW
jgi:hypothetical protein